MLYNADKYAGMDHDHYQYAATLDCIRTSSKDEAIGLARVEKYRNALMRGSKLVDLKAGQLVVYRCVVESLLTIPLLKPTSVSFEQVLILWDIILSGELVPQWNI